MPPALPPGALPESFNALLPVNLLSERLPPIQSLPRLSSHIASLVPGGTTANIYFYREDLASPLAFGGNKVRKLEYVLYPYIHPSDSNDSPATVLLTEGGFQSNHARQTSAAAASLGLKCVVLLAPLVQSDDPNYKTLGNVQINHLLGAEIRYLGNQTQAEFSSNVKQELEAQGETVAWIPRGASLDERGGIGYARWVFELLVQECNMVAQLGGKGFQHIVVACASGSTLAGMVAGLKLAESLGMTKTGAIKVTGIDARAGDVQLQRQQVLKIARTAGRLLGLKEEGKYWPRLEDVDIDERWNGGQYGRCDEPTRNIVKLVARMEGVLLDPVYTGKAMRGVVEGIKEGKLQGNVLFVHTGGQSALSGYGGIELD